MFVSVINGMLQKVIIFVCMWPRCVIKNVAYSILCLYCSMVPTLPKKNKVPNILCTHGMCVCSLAAIRDGNINNCCKVYI